MSLTGSVLITPHTHTHRGGASELRGNAARLVGVEGTACREECSAVLPQPTGSVWRSAVHRPVLRVGAWQGALDAETWRCGGGVI